jgi:hypothetical protein
MSSRKTESQIQCECGGTYTNKGKSRHFRSKKHLNFFKTEEVEQVGDVDVETEDSESIEESETTEPIENVISYNEDVDDFLDDLTNEKWKPQVEEPKNTEPAPKIKEVRFPFEFKEPKKKEKEPKFEEEDKDLFSDTPTQIMGVEKRALIHKIKSYKLLFKEELSKFKLKKGASIKDLEEALIEINVIINTNLVDQFVEQSVIQGVVVVENISSKTKNWNLTGLSKVLMQNPQFIKLLRQCYLKYGASFINVPCEYQLIGIVISSAFLIRQSNIEKSRINDYLNTPLNS